ncbi:glycoside hydrolase family 1 protein [Spiroplasma clarkii]|uniref:glycoside hydrolase family 1 protein n=1 Tax=Spiroplasma clarkii TaxID=2139 RepID=UPI002029D7AF|nr:family 1 glycosylhydrolase [Spiroplasma clarkii]
MKKDKFYFSVSTNAFQIEGGRNLHGRTDSLWDWFTKTYYHIPPVNSTAREINSIVEASDFYHKYPSDVKILSKLGVDAFIYNLDWARVFPTDGTKINPMGIQFYDRVFSELVAGNVKPIPILFHWDTPMWAEIKGGWTNREILTSFKNYCAAMFKYLGKYTDIWFVNDENKSFTVDGYLTGQFPPCFQDENAFVKAVHHLALSGAIAKAEFKKAKELGYVSPDAILGIDDDWSPPVIMAGVDADQKLIDNYNAWMRDLWLDPNLKGTYPQEFLDYIKSKKLDLKITPADLKLLQDNKLDFIGWNFYRPYFITSKTALIPEDQLHRPPGKLPFGDFQIVLPKIIPTILNECDQLHPNTYKRVCKV